MGWVGDWCKVWTFSGVGRVTIIEKVCTRGDAGRFAVWSFCDYVITECPLFSANTYLFKVGKRNTRKKWELCSKSVLKTPERHQWRPLFTNPLISIYSKDLYVLHLIFYFFFFFEKKHVAPKDIDDPRERIFWSLQLFKINLSAQRKACDICGKENQAKMYFFS